MKEVFPSPSGAATTSAVCCGHNFARRGGKGTKGVVKERGGDTALKGTKTTGRESNRGADVLNAPTDAKAHASRGLAAMWARGRATAERGRAGPSVLLSLLLETAAVTVTLAGAAAVAACSYSCTASRASRTCITKGWGGASSDHIRGRTRGGRTVNTVNDGGQDWTGASRAHLCLPAPERAGLGHGEAQVGGHRLLPGAEPHLPRRPAGGIGCARVFTHPPGPGPGPA